jgi:hypothetical protein
VKEQFDPIRGKRGEFRVALNLSELGERAWEILSLAQELGFEQPQFRTHTRHSGYTEVSVDRKFIREQVNRSL